MKYEFEWDELKSQANLKKHEISFQEATTVFYDDFARIFDDFEHSINEIRELIIGTSNKNRILIVSFTERKNKIRIISARKVTKIERIKYEENFKN